MYFLRTLLILEVSTWVWKNGQANPKVEYDKLLNIDTGYMHGDIKRPHVLYAYVMQGEEIPESKVAETKQTVYNNLLCSFVFTGCHYMNLIKVLVDRSNLADGENKFLLEDIFHNDAMHTSLFQLNVVGMFFVLHNLGTVNSLDPLWLMYAYLECLKTIVSHPVIDERNIKGSTVISRDHDIIYNTLTRFTDKCGAKNMYNHRYPKSPLYGELQRFDFPETNVNLLVRKLFAEIIQTESDRFSQITNALSLPYSVVYFSADDLHLNGVACNKTVMKTLLNDFAEAEEGLDTYQEILKFCNCNRLELVSVRSLVAGLAGCLAIFVDLTKYIIARNAIKYVLDVRSTLPSSKNPKESAKWIFHSDLATTNETMSNHYKDIVSFLKIDEDEEFKFVGQLFASEPQAAFGDSNKNIENRIMNMLETFSKGLHYFPSIPISRANFDSSYKRDRNAHLVELAKRIRVDIRGSGENKYEGMLDLFVFKNYIVSRFGEINFEMVHSFFEFSKKIYD